MRFLTIISLTILTVFSACSPNNVKEDKSLGKYFSENKVKGCFALMDNGTGMFTVYNLSRYRDSSYVPASTFKIVNALVGLQTGKITDENMVIRWDGVTRPVEAWNKDLTMQEAFRVSSVPYFQEVARRIGKDTMQFYLDSLHYGTTKITSAIDTFWLDNSLKVTPDEELGLVKRLYFDQLPFYKVYQGKVKMAMKVESNTNYELAYKTGLSGWDERTGRRIGWVVGWVVENKHPYFFVLNIESSDKNLDMAGLRLKMLNDILKQLGFLEGKM